MTNGYSTAQPNITVGSSEVAGRTVRGSIQGGLGYFICEGIEAFKIYDFDDRQWAWAVLALGGVITLGQNLIEQRRGRKFIGASPVSPSVPPADVEFS